MDPKRPMYGKAPSQWNWEEGQQFVQDFLELNSKINYLARELDMPLWMRGQDDTPRQLSTENDGS